MGLSGEGQALEHRHPSRHISFTSLFCLRSALGEFQSSRANARCSLVKFVDKDIGANMNVHIFVGEAYLSAWGSSGRQRW